MVGSIFLKRKHHPRNSIWRRGSTRSTLENHQMLYLSEIDKTKVIDLSDNVAFVSALDTIIDRAKEILKKRNRRLRIWVPDYSFAHVDFVRLYEELQKK